MPDISSHYPHGDYTLPSLLLTDNLCLIILLLIILPPLDTASSSVAVELVFPIQEVLYSNSGLETGCLTGFFQFSSLLQKE
jgi:hypothetical protein